MSAHHRPASTDYLHDAAETSECRVPSDAQREAIELLELGDGRLRVRLSCADWRRVERVAAALEKRKEVA